MVFQRGEYRLVGAVWGENAAIIPTIAPVLTLRPLKHASNLFGQNRVLLVAQTMRVRHGSPSMSEPMGVWWVLSAKLVRIDCLFISTLLPSLR
jgi:hypothetical protein